MTIRFTPAARLEVLEALSWYEARASGLGAQFQSQIDAQVQRIAENPLQFPIMYADIRRARLRQFPYSLFFRTLGEEIFVIACFHASRDPRRWEGRT